jgi:coniferyl-aldehyde dehydrogenase
MNEIKSIEQLEPILASLKQNFAAEVYPDYQQRIKDLKNLKNMLLDNQQAIIDAIASDFGHRSQDDTKIGDLLSSVQGINYAIRNLRSWMKPQRRHVGILFQPASAKVLYQPLGVVGIIVPWNYPLFLALGPLTYALAAGNRAMIKMSELSVNLSALLADLLATYIGPNKVAVVGGEADVARAFSALPFDHIFFTGSTNIGKQVMRAAAENLVPITLELGGKSPALIAPEMAIQTAVSRLILGKTFNAGQTCVAPDYVLCPKDKISQLVEQFEAFYTQLYPTTIDNNDCTSIVSDKHFSRLQALLHDAKEKGAEIITLGVDSASPQTRKMPLTLVLNVSDDMRIMQEEIFGPILPLLTYESLTGAIEYVNKRPRPLALYLYSFDKHLQNQVARDTHSGGMVANDASFQVVIDDLPFGGIGASGMGNYHGKEGFLTFSHAKAIFRRGKINFTPMLFPPFGKAIHKLVYRFFIR